ncbi:hypothetical protein ACP70R_009733 [Stipagrostis hirtigluma subsp. patula]
MELPTSIRAPTRSQPRQLVRPAAPPASVTSLAASPSRDHRARGLGAREAGVSSFGPWAVERDASPLPRGRGGRTRAVRRPRASLSGEEGDVADAAAGRRRPRFLCLHGFRTSGEIMRRQVTGRWPPEVTSRLDLVFPDAPFPAGGASPVAGAFDPPYYEWCQFVGEDFLRCRNFDRCLSYVEELMAGEGPFDGLLGFSQGAGLSAVLAGLQEQGLALTGVTKVKFVVVIAGGKIRSPAAATRAFAGKIKCPSLHFIGDDDFVRVHSEELVESFEDPLVIRHPKGHTVPKLDEKGLQVMLSYLGKIEREMIAVEDW